MKYIVAIFLTITISYANAKKDMYELYKSKKFSQACNIGLNNFSNYANDESYISLYAFSCLETNFIDRLAIPIIKLKFTPQGRANSAYFSVILMQKKLLYHSLIDGYDLSSFNFPSTKHIISKVFDAYTSLGKHNQKKYYIFQDKNDKLLKYKLYLIKPNKLKKMVIEEIYNNKIIKKHTYW